MPEMSGFIGSCVTPHEVAYVYRERLGLPVDQNDVNLSVLTSDRLGVVEMPEPVGRLVSRHLPTAAVLGHPRRRQWRFLVRPSRVVIGELTARALAERGVITLAPDSRVPLPTSSHTGWYWITAPRRAPNTNTGTGSGVMVLPPSDQILNAAKSASYQALPLIPNREVRLP
ncbi:hypothetical protein IU487_34985 [Nocardia puris]|uniref:hypothetical protein n=1 Tax=Nocardia puris TaxID=208602 RepID=UPI0018943D51|nr:hypothetical protein [Nocardia puris]MBF6216202.1 hypothetical protein [Nocardia puris]